MGLHVGVLGTEELLGAVDRELLDHVDILAAAVIAAAGIAFGIFVGKKRAGCLKHGLGDDVLRSDQLDLVLLTIVLFLDRIPDFGIGLLQMLGEEGIGTRLGASCITCRHRTAPRA